MKKLLLEPHYLGSLEYFCLIHQQNNVLLEVNDSFQKQTFRNRAYLLSANRVLPIIVPLTYANGTLTKDVRIDHSQRWVKDHWGAFYSSYGKAPFFEYFAEEFQSIWRSDTQFLVDLDLQMLNLCFKLLNKSVKLEMTSTFEDDLPSDILDYRGAIHPKIGFSDRNIYQPTPYSQLFGNSFVPNLSIVDLIMCEGPRAGEVLTLSFRED